MSVIDRNGLNRLGEVLEESVGAGQIAGGNLCVLCRGEEVYYAEAGYADIANQKKITKDSIFRLYSMTKPVTSAAVMLLMERGVIDLLDPVSKYIPTFGDIKVASSEGDVAAVRQVTIKDCLSMTSGLAYNCDPDPASRAAALVYDELDRRLYSDDPMTTMEMASKLGQGRLAFQPGECWRYGTSADILGAVVESASGVRFGEFLRREFFEPLNMNDTGFCLDAAKRDRLTKVYEKTACGLVEYHGNHLGICNHMDADIRFESGGAGLVSTIADYRHFAQMLMNRGTYQGRTYLAPATVAYMTGCRLYPHQQAMMAGWESLAGYSYSNLMRVMTDPSLAVINGSQGEYGWDGWLGPYFANMPGEETTFLMMVQLRDAGTFTLTRKLRNVLAALLSVQP
ncbi:MAG: beta-lactamase family protein [Lachnospiraceae bacterium]|nr:beta-lactamase family protein [Lachnospiraceae bacterium]